MRKVFKVLKVLVVVAVAITVVGFVVMHLWNWLMPAIFGLRTLSFWQAVGLFVLSKLLLSGFHGGRHHGGGPRWGRHMRDRWKQMTPEQQERFRKGMRGWRDCYQPGDRGRRSWGEEAQPHEEVSHG